jgi:predicted XRE-type DNA-binding protein
MMCSRRYDGKHGKNAINEIAIMAIKSALRLLLARENLRRAEAGQPELTQSEIAANSGVSQSVISTLVSGKSNRIDFDTIRSVVRVFSS